MYAGVSAEIPFYFFTQVLLSALDNAVNEEEQRSVVSYIAFAANPQPKLISELETE